MKNEQFTPGPWLAIGPKIQPDLEQTYFSIQSQSGKITKDTYECPGFYYPHSVQSEDTMQANANLIAAAPDMYEALKKLEINLIVLANDQRTPKVISGLIYQFMEDCKVKMTLNKANGISEFIKHSDIIEAAEAALSKANPQ